MMKFVLIAVFALCFVACQNENKSTNDVDALRDSLDRVISQKDNEINDLLGTFNDVQNSIREIGRAQGRVTGFREGTNRMTAAEVQEEMSFIQQSILLNRQRIARLQQQIKSSSAFAEELKNTIAELTRQIEEKQQQIELLEKQLREKNIIIESQDKQIGQLNSNVNSLTADNETKSQIIAQQDKEQHTAWYVFGTKKELKDQKILQNSEVLHNDSYNKDYFTKIDIRTVTSIKLYSKNAKLLTDHPESSYTLEKGKDKQLTLVITDSKKFWSISKYLVILVK